LNPCNQDRKRTNKTSKDNFSW